VLVIAESGAFDGYVSASAITDIFYVARKTLASKEKALALVRDLLEVVHVAAVDEGIIRDAVELTWNDFEDSVQYVAGEKLAADYIVTRDPRGFVGSSIETVNPKTFVSLFSAE
jgi:predicted nucleic-acid-binding protein